MQKKLIALAIAGLSGAAFAQSNVTVYGVADATFDVINVSSDKGTPNSNIGSFNRVSTNSSLIGFKGVEDMGNGLKAVFQYESSVGFDNAGALGTSRDSFVALAGGFGTVALGNLTGPTRAFGAAVDVNDGATGIGANSALIGKLGNTLTGTLDTTVTTDSALAQVVGTGATACGRSSTCTSAFDTRFKNAIAYISPDLSGFTIIAGYVANEGKGTDAAGGKPNPSAWDLGVKYANGPILVGLSHADVKLRNTADTTANITRLVGSYDFGMGTVRGLWEKTKAKVGLLGVDADQSVWGLGATLKAGSGDVIAQYYRANDMGGNLRANNANSGAKLFEVGYQYNLSKRTMLKGVYSRLANDDNSWYDYGVNASGMGAISTTRGFTVSGIQVGIRHKF